MSKPAWARTERMIGAAACERLAAAHVLVVGLGGVGSYAAEALGRGGIGTLTLVDFDRVSASNLNRQLVALTSTLGRLKVEVMRDRLLDIHPGVVVHDVAISFSAETADTLDWSRYSYVVDAIDRIEAKVELVARAHAAGVPIISAMGTGNKLDPSGFVVTELFQTANCPLARLMRKRLRKRGVDALEVVFSPERAPLFSKGAEADAPAVPGSLPFVPGVAGLMMAGVVFRRIAGVCP